MFKLQALVLTTLSILASTAALAGGPTSTLTRAEVTAEYVRARAAGDVALSGYDTIYSLKSHGTSMLTRADVQAEYARAKAAGELDHVSGYSSVVNTLSSAAPTASALTRADVVNEYLRARSSGELAEASPEFGPPQYRRVMQ